MKPTAEPPAPLESCPSCLSRNHAPALTERINAETIVGHYLCVLCGETLETSYWTGVQDA